MRLFVVALILLATVVAAQQGDYVPIEDTRCYDCHAPQNDPVRPMNPGFIIDPGFALLAPEMRLEPALVNTWLSELHEMVFELDLSKAPSLSFQGGRDRVHVEETGAIPVSPLSQDWQTASIQIPVPGDSTTTRIQLTPTGTLAADVRLTVTDGGGQEVAIVDEAGRGDAELVHLEGADAARIGGNWTIEAAVKLVRGTVVDPHVTDVPFVVRMDSWSNASLERSVAKSAVGPVLPGGRLAFPFDVQTTDPQPGEQVTMTAKFRFFYEHGDGNPDNAWIIETATFPLEASPDGVVLGTQAVVVPAPIEEIMGADRVGEIIGYAAAFLMIASMVSGGVLGKGSRRGLNTVFGSARRRVAFHNFLSYGIIVAAFAHFILFLIETQWHWALGLIWGGSGILFLLLLGVTGAMQVPIIRRWNYQTWKWIHFGCAIAAIVFTVIHILLDGTHFSGFSNDVGWVDPLVPESRQ